MDAEMASSARRPPHRACGLADTTIASLSLPEQAVSAAPADRDRGKRPGPDGRLSAVHRVSNGRSFHSGGRRSGESGVQVPLYFLPSGSQMTPAWPGAEDAVSCTADSFHSLAPAVPRTPPYHNRALLHSPAASLAGGVSPSPAPSPAPSPSFLPGSTGGRRNPRQRRSVRPERVLPSYRVQVGMSTAQATQADLPSLSHIHSRMRLRVQTSDASAEERGITSTLALPSPHELASQGGLSQLMKGLSATASLTGNDLSQLCAALVAEASDPEATLPDSDCSARPRVSSSHVSSGSTYSSSVSSSVSSSSSSSSISSSSSSSSSSTSYSPPSSSTSSTSSRRGITEGEMPCETRADAMTTQSSSSTSSTFTSTSTSACSLRLSGMEEVAHLSLRSTATISPSQLRRHPVDGGRETTSTSLQLSTERLDDAVVSSIEPELEQPFAESVFLHRALGTGYGSHERVAAARVPRGLHAATVSRPSAGLTVATRTPPVRALWPEDTRAERLQRRHQCGGGGAGGSHSGQQMLAVDCDHDESALPLPPLPELPSLGHPSVLSARPSTRVLVLGQRGLLSRAPISSLHGSASARVAEASSLETSLDTVAQHESPFSQECGRFSSSSAVVFPSSSSSSSSDVSNSTVHGAVKSEPFASSSSSSSSTSSSSTSSSTTSTSTASSFSSPSSSSASQPMQTPSDSVKRARRGRPPSGRPRGRPRKVPLPITQLSETDGSIENVTSPVRKLWMPTSESAAQSPDELTVSSDVEQACSDSEAVDEPRGVKPSGRKWGSKRSASVDRKPRKRGRSSKSAAERSRKHEEERLRLRRQRTLPEGAVRCAAVNPKKNTRCRNAALMEYMGPRPMYCAEHIEHDQHSLYCKCGSTFYQEPGDQRGCKEIVLREFSHCYKHFAYHCQALNSPQELERCRVLLARSDMLIHRLAEEVNLAKRVRPELCQRKAKLIPKYSKVQSILKEHLLSHQALAPPSSLVPPLPPPIPLEAYSGLQSIEERPVSAARAGGGRANSEPRPGVTSVRSSAPAGSSVPATASTHAATDPRSPPRHARSETGGSKGKLHSRRTSSMSLSSDPLSPNQLREPRGLCPSDSESEPDLDCLVQDSPPLASTPRVSSAASSAVATSPCSTIFSSSSGVNSSILSPPNLASTHRLFSPYVHSRRKRARESSSDFSSESTITVSVSQAPSSSRSRGRTRSSTRSSSGTK